ncbi:hypothetical protein [Paenarthrobacter sp. 22069]|uniref:hypothetical protein n=1 Tax=Paenarthrobacter sp. 22069 TaxID=3453864 RepID=UPI003F86AB82
MSGQYTVSATQAALKAGAVTQTVASLPATFKTVAEAHAGTADVLVMAGGAGWTADALAAVAAGTRGIVVVNPVPEDTTELAAAAKTAGTAVVLDLRWASNPALVAGNGQPDARGAVRSAMGSAALLDSVAASTPGTELPELLAAHLAALLAVSGQLGDVRVIRSDSTGYTVGGRLPNGAPFTAQGVLTAARPAGVGIHLYTADGGVDVRVPDPDAAWPAEVRVTGAHGQLLLPTLYESAHRSAWRRLKDHLGAGTLPDDLAGFARLADLYSTLAAT